MHAFKTLSAIAAPLPMINVDTDMIISKLFLRTIKRTGLGANLFDEMRFDDDRNEIPTFVLNKEPYRKAKILISGDNFGCGSSREHAPWALLDFGIRCIIAPSYADIFYNNCFKNGILPVYLPQEHVDILMKHAQDMPEEEISIDLEKQTVTAPDGESFDFEVDSFRKHCLMNGLDDIALTLEKEKSISSFEDARADKQPWLAKNAG